MSELALSMQSLLRPRVTIAAVLISAATTILALAVQPTPLQTSLAASATCFAAFWSGLAVITTSRFHVFRPGSDLIPRYRSQAVLSAALIGLTLAWLPVAAAAARGFEAATLLALATIGFAAAWVSGPFFPDNVRVALSVLSVAIGIDLVIYVESAGPHRVFWITGVDPLWQKLGLVVLALGVIAWSGRHMAAACEDHWILRRWRSRDRGDCMECGSQGGVPEFIVQLLPPFARRTLPKRDNGRTVESQLQRSLYRYSLSPFSPAGLTLIYVPFVVVLSSLAKMDAVDTSLYWNPNLLLLNGLIIWFSGMTRARVRREWIRPSSRRDIVESIVGGLSRDVAAFTGYFLLMTLIVHAVMAPQAMTTSIYWLGFAMAPFLMCLGFGLALVAAQWGRWGGLFGFFVGWILAVLGAAAYEEDTSLQSFGICVGASILAAAVGLALQRRGRRYWREVELG